MPVTPATLTPPQRRTTIADGDRQQSSGSGAHEQPEAPAPREHVVVRGDSLTKIAATHGTTVAALLNENPALRRAPNQLRIGERVKLPEPARVAADSQTVLASRGRALGNETLARARVGDVDALKVGVSGAAVRTLQAQLNAAGAARPALEVDGDFGPRTEAAVKRYQSSRGLTPSGVVDEPTRTALAERRAAQDEALQMGAFGAPVRALQEQLNAHGAHLTVDGDFGAGTERAVRAFQRANNLDDDGVVGPDTRRALDDPNAARVPERAAVERTATGYRNGRPFQLELVSIGNGESLAAEAAASFAQMKDAAARDGVNLNVVSGFRSNEEQTALYRAYQRGRGNLAAPPGYSNHQNGIAVDITTGGSRRSASYRWLAENGARFGFHNTVPSEPWHWEYLR